MNQCSLISISVITYTYKEAVGESFSAITGVKVLLSHLNEDNRTDSTTPFCLGICLKQQRHICLNPNVFLCFKFGLYFLQLYIIQVSNLI